MLSSRVQWLAPRWPTISRSARSRRGWLLTCEGKGSGVSGEAKHEPAPNLHGLAALVQKVMALVDGHNAAEGAGGVVEALLDHVQRHAQAGTAGGERPPQIVQPPGREFFIVRRGAACDSREPLHRLGDARERRAAGGSEQQRG